MTEDEINKAAYEDLLFNYEVLREAHKSQRAALIHAENQLKGACKSRDYWNEAYEELKLEIEQDRSVHEFKAE